MRSRILAFWCLSTAMVALLIGCNKQPLPTINPSGDAFESSANTDVGKPLYAPVAAPVYAAVAPRGEPLVIPNCIVQYDERQSVSAEVDGIIEVFGTPVKPGEIVEPDRVVYRLGDTQRAVPYRRLSESDKVEIGQLIAITDDQQIIARIKGLNEVKAAAIRSHKNAAEGVEFAKQRLGLEEKAAQAGTAGQTSLVDAQTSLSRFRENESNQLQTIAKSSAELEEAAIVLTKHSVRSRVNGIIRTLTRRPGEYVRAGEKIMEIEGTDKVRLEGNLDVQYYDQVRLFMQKKDHTVFVEPALPSAPIVSHSSHRQQVTGVAVTAHADGPLVVSVGADGAALVWDPNLSKRPNRSFIPHNLPHPVAAKSVAATPATAKVNYVITGGDDGKVRIWDVANRAKLPVNPKAEPEDTHASAVQAIAISPNGLYFATAAGRDVFVWELATAKKLYALPTEHRDSVTAVSFTPQNTLITASRDSTIKVWKLGVERAAAIRTLDHRAGAIDVLGVNRDGSRVLFDKDKGRVDLVDPASGLTIGQIQNVGSAGTFSTLALFGPDEVPPGTPVDKLPPYSIATAGGDGDLKGTLQYWHAPRAGGRGAEVGRLITPGRAPITAAAFSPVPGEINSFVVVGTQAGSVHLWKPPSEVRQQHLGKLVHIDATDARYVTVRVELNNRVLRLLDHSVANVIINP